MCGAAGRYACGTVRVYPIDAIGRQPQGPRHYTANFHSNSSGEATSHMIVSVADLLLQLKEKEGEMLALVDITHGPTIGDMYEGLSKDILSRTFPLELDLQLKSGFIVDGAGNKSPQIDLMLVRGIGDRIPYTDSHIWHIQNVIAVFEIKKTLLGQELEEDLEKAAALKELEFSYRSTLLDRHEPIDIESGLNAFELTTGLARPSREEVPMLPPLEQLIYHSMAFEQFSVIRILFGYQGFKTERGFRSSLAKIFEKYSGIKRGPAHLPHLVISGQFSIVKATGQPYICPIENGLWSFYLSSSANPLRLLLELLWTRLSREYNVGNLWGDDLDVEVLKPYFLTGAIKNDDHFTWDIKYMDIPEGKLKVLGDTVPWNPTTLTAEQLAVMQLLLSGNRVSVNDPEIGALLDEANLSPEDFWSSLRATRLVVLRGSQIELITNEFMALMLSDGTIVAADNESGRLTRWLSAHGHG